MRFFAKRMSNEVGSFIICSLTVNRSVESGKFAEKGRAKSCGVFCRFARD